MNLQCNQTYEIMNKAIIIQLLLKLHIAKPISMDGHNNYNNDF